uniref:DDHD domain-containing protein n=1 Tax=Macrostomum lignano TaxID=282301 RepID=A0A1I8HRG1_9PLAT
LDQPAARCTTCSTPATPCSFRMEPLLADRFRWLAPVQLPKYSLLPCGDGQPLSVLEAVTSCGDVFLSGGGGGGEGDGGGAAGSSRQLSRQDSNSSSASSSLELSQVAAIQSVCRRWWGPKRLDYSLHCPDTLSRFPINAMPLLFHASYWESADAAAFILRQFVDAASVAELLEITDSAITESSLGGHIDDRLTLRVPGRQREKWRNRANAIKLKNAAPNHRANDVIVAEGQAQVLTARFMYGPFDMLSLSDEVIDVHVMSQPPSSGEWSYVGSCNTDSHGKAVFSVPAERRLPQGVYPVKMVARGDHSSADLNLAVLPPATECVVFSVDGSFAASVSIMGADPKVRPGAVDVVRHWQDLGYLLVYISARPDMQQRRVVGWLAQHNFPHGMVFFMDGFTAEPLRQKTACLTKLAGQAGLLIHAAYGSSKDIAVYQSLNLRRGQIFIIGKAGKKHAGNATILSEGYAAHLSALQSAQYECSRPAQGVGRHVVRRGCFGLPQPSMSSGRGSPSAAATSDSSDSAQQQN